MKASKFIPSLLVLLEFMFEYLYLKVDNILFDVKFALLGVACIVVGVLGIWLYNILPFLDKKHNYFFSKGKQL